MRERLMQDRARLYEIRDVIYNATLELIAGESVVSYSIGGRSVTHTSADLKTMQESLIQLDNRIDDIEALLSGRSPRGVITNSYVEPSNVFFTWGR
jgi:hypothetical protein